MNGALAPVRLAETLHLARTRGASDVHLIAGTPPVLRVDGSLETQQGPCVDDREIDSIAATVLSASAREQLESSGDVTTAYRALDLGTVRIHAYRTARGLAFAMRLLAISVPDLEALHLPPVVLTLIDRPAGLVLFTGPTGSGKSTALSALVAGINHAHSKHIITIEDPIEYEHVSERSVISQRQVGADVGSYAQAIYGALRCDPDVILIGEMRESSTIHAALTAAETGHLVLSTLHTGDAPQTVDRVIGAFTGEMQDHVRILLAQTLAAVVCTRLVPRACGQGRRSAVEVMIATDAVRNVIRDGKTHQLRNIIATSKDAGMQTLEAHLSDLLARREITLDAAKVATERADDLRNQFCVTV